MCGQISETAATESLSLLPICIWISLYLPAAAGISWEEMSRRTEVQPLFKANTTWGGRRGKKVHSHVLICHRFCPVCVWLGSLKSQNAGPRLSADQRENSAVHKQRVGNDFQTPFFHRTCLVSPLFYTVFPEWWFNMFMAGFSVDHTAPEEHPGL